MVQKTIPSQHHLIPMIVNSYTYIVLRRKHRQATKSKKKTKFYTNKDRSRCCTAAKLQLQKSHSAIGDQRNNLNDFLQPPLDFHKHLHSSKESRLLHLCKSFIPRCRRRFQWEIKWDFFKLSRLGINTSRWVAWYEWDSL